MRMTKLGMMTTTTTTTVATDNNSSKRYGSLLQSLLDYFYAVTEWF